MKVENIYTDYGKIVGQMHIYQFNFREKKDHKIILVNSYINEYEDISQSCFTSAETTQLEQYSITKKRNEYLLGRYTMKMAISCFTGLVNKQDIEIGYGVLQYPVVISDSSGIIEVSLTHCNSRAIAIVYNKDIMLGIDLEQVNYKKYEFLDKITLESERELYKKCVLNYNTFLTLLWTAKEALSKAIKTGFTIDMNVFQIGSIECRNDSYFIGYTYFPSFEAVAKVKDDHIYTLAYIKKVDITDYVNHMIF
ncbi:4'-phosphopantetheinyl transferase superfamily protein [Clostridium estertheticum]|uniref:4'-phosphopantetheinyl transferase family protein n=1 Tax=Clostridium estertheticum TaxID=238834 RepID=UPI0013EEA3D9|nr:4'-phosphopantetheinyl transferase superfamily protein [Clostridium estertheticum]MBZ9609908.1 4'-phosphopantetheinyl transferase superfamily protein [Clostridium estertheticum]